MNPPKPSKSIEQMTPDELCTEASRIREHIVSSAELLGGIYSALYSRVRRPSRVSSEASPLSMGEIYAYTSVANAGKRLSAMMLQAVKRTSYMDRLIRNAKADAEEVERAKQHKDEVEDRKSLRQKSESNREREFRARLFGGDSQTTQEDLIQLYGDV